MIEAGAKYSIIVKVLGIGFGIIFDVVFSVLVSFWDTLATFLIIMGHLGPLGDDTVFGKRKHWIFLGFPMVVGSSSAIDVPLTLRVRDRRDG